MARALSRVTLFCAASKNTRFSGRIRAEKRSHCARSFRIKLAEEIRDFVYKLVALHIIRPHFFGDLRLERLATFAPARPLQTSDIVCYFRYALASVSLGSSQTRSPLRSSGRSPCAFRPEYAAHRWLGTSITRSSLGRNIPSRLPFMLMGRPESFKPPVRTVIRFVGTLQLAHLVHPNGPST